MSMKVLCDTVIFSIEILVIATEQLDTMVVMGEDYYCVVMHVSRPALRAHLF